MTAPTDRNIASRESSEHDSPDLRADDDAPIVARPRTPPAATPDEIVKRFQRIGERRRRVWRPCIGCQTPVASPQVACDICAGWSALFAELDGIRRSVGAFT